MLKQNLFSSIAESAIIPNFLDAATHFKEIIQANNPSEKLSGLNSELKKFKEQIEQIKTENPFDCSKENKNPSPL